MLANFSLRKSLDGRGMSLLHHQLRYIACISRYVEWEKYPHRKAIASHILQAHQSEFTPIPGISIDATALNHKLTSFTEFQLEPLPKTNPVLIGYRWKEYHELLGLKSIVDFSWEDSAQGEA